MMDVKKRKISLEIKKIYTKRKLKNILLDQFQDYINQIDQIYLDENELNSLKLARQLSAKTKCENYKLDINENYVVLSSAKVYANKIPIEVRKNIEMFEEAHNIKTMFYDYVKSNIRGENYKLYLGE
jgi:hypothetical protein